MSDPLYRVLTPHGNEVGRGGTPDEAWASAARGYGVLGEVAEGHARDMEATGFRLVVPSGPVRRRTKRAPAAPSSSLFDDQAR